MNAEGMGSTNPTPRACLLSIPWHWEGFSFFEKDVGLAVVFELSHESLEFQKVAAFGVCWVRRVPNKSCFSKAQLG